MPTICIFILFYFLSSQRNLDAFAVEGMPGFSGLRDVENSEKRMEGHYVVSDANIEVTTMESENKTNIFSNVWHKISNIFGGETTTEVEIEPEIRNEVLTPTDGRPLNMEPEMRNEVLKPTDGRPLNMEPEMRNEVLKPTDGRPLNRKEENGRDLRMAPVDFSRLNEDRTWQKEAYDEGNYYPFHPHLRQKRSSLQRSFDANAILATEVRKRRESPVKGDQTLKYVITEKPTDPAAKKVPIIVEEFDQGETEGERMKRSKEGWKSTDWQTEKIAVGSDPVENIDKTNFIEETMKDDFPLHDHSLEPIIVEDSLSGEITTSSEKELSPLKIIQY